MGVAEYMTASSARKPESVDEYLAALSEDRRAALAQLRAAIRAAAPGATESISWRMPFYRYHGKPLVAFAAFRNHTGFYGLTSSFLDAFREDVKDYETSVGTIRFPIGKPLPLALVRRLVKARMAEIEARHKKT